LIIHVQTGIWNTEICISLNIGSHILYKSFFPMNLGQKNIVIIICYFSFDDTISIMYIKDALKIALNNLLTRFYH
jgi:hypothetical protein